MNEIKFYQTQWFTFLMLFVFAPVGIYLLWKNRHYNQQTNTMLTLVFCFCLLFMFNGIINPSTNYNTIQDNKDFLAEVEKNKPATKSPTPIETTPEETTPTETPTPIPTPKKDIYLGSGNYFAGEDFPVGTYDLIAVEGNGNVISSNSIDGGVNALMGTSPDYDYEKEYKNIRFPKGTELKLMGVKIKLSPK